MMDYGLFLNCFHLCSKGINEKLLTSKFVNVALETNAYSGKKILSSTNTQLIKVGVEKDSLKDKYNS